MAWVKISLRAFEDVAPHVMNDGDKGNVTVAVVGDGLCFLLVMIRRGAGAADALAPGI